jgi:isoaspartyl peptidase/L-asparaginase-like protein (Ntn-hydrolase superfamily)
MLLNNTLRCLIIFLLYTITNKPIMAQTNNNPAPTWAIAIHGGAGGNAVAWSEEKKAKRLAGLTIALETGKKILANGGTSLDAVEATIRVLEDDPAFNAGRGAVVTAEGKAELDASIMDGATHACGGVAAVTNVKNPISLARLVMEKTKHVLLVSKGAEAFAVDQKVPLVDPAYFLSVQPVIDADTLLVQSSTPVMSASEGRIGTVGCVCRDTQGNLAAGTSTGGTNKKLQGRVGDSPIVGAGTYASNETCAVSGTGIGEEFIRYSVAYDIAAQMKYAHRPIQEAVSEMISVRLKPDDGGVIALSRHGEIVMQHNTPSMSCGAADSNGRFEVMLGVDQQ